MNKLAMLVVAGLLTTGSAKAADPLTDLIDGLVGNHGQNNTYTVVGKKHRGHQRADRGDASEYHSTNTGGSSVLASFYGHGEKLNAHTATGERFNPYGMTAAHRTLPLGSRLLVEANGRTVVVRVNDRGPAAYTGRGLDLSYGAARALGITGAGVARVHIARL